MPLSSGTRFGPYEIEAPLGSGGMGEVYRARDTRLGRFVAVKILPGGAAADPSFRERFAREARTISSISHPNICALFDVGEQDGTAYLVMEYLDGESLASRLARGALPVGEAVRCAAQIADGLARAHSLGIVHRDLKPGNVMLVSDGLVKILDFGLAKRFVANPGDATVAAISEMGVLSGTVAYMAPEQALGGLVDHRSDLFSLGVVLYEMLTGARPFHGASAYSIMHKITSERAPEVEVHGVDLPRPVKDLLEHLLQKSPESRPQSAQEVAAELRGLMGQSVSGTWSPSGRARPVPSRRRGRWTMAAGVTVLAGALLIVPAVRTRVTSVFSGASTGGAGSELPPASSKTSYEWIKEGREALLRFDRKQNIDRAIQLLTRAVQADPTHAFAHASLAEAYLRKDASTPDPQWIRQATEAARKSVALNPDLAAAHAALGLVLTRDKKPDEGRAAIQKALDLDPTLPLANLGLGDFFLTRGDAKAAEAVFRKAAGQSPDDWHPVQQVGRSLYAQARYAEAATTWEHARKISPDNALVLRNLGAVYHQLGRTDDAAAALQRSLEIEPSATTYNNLATLRFFQGRYSDAAAAFEKAVGLNATYFLYWANLADAYRRVPGSESKAAEAYASAIRLVRERLKAAPADPDLQSQLAMYLARSGAKDEAKLELQHWAELPKKTPASHFRALIVHELGGRRDAAIAALGDALKAGYGITEIREEPDLAGLRADPRYQRIVTSYETGKTR